MMLCLICWLTIVTIMSSHTGEASCRLLYTFAFTLHLGRVFERLAVELMSWC